MKRGRMQAKDIGDDEFLGVVLRVQGRSQRRLIRKFGQEGNWSLKEFYTEHLPCATWGIWGADYDSERAIAFRREYGPFINDYFREVPRKVLVAKARRLIDRGLLTGCVCGCRGDFELTDAGLARLLFADLFA